MKIEDRYREFLPEARRVVVKVGSRVIEQKTGKPDAASLRRLVSQISKLHHQGYEIILVSSGAVGAGMDALGLKTRPALVTDQQMCAAVGQARLMAQYQGLFGKEGITIGQLLLTHMDFQHRLRLSNAKRTLEHLIRNNVIPIVTENDVGADEEVKAISSFGDNDYLASLVVKVTRADVLVILSTVDGVLDAQEKRVPLIEDLKEAFRLVNPALSNGGLSKGGMDSKLKAAQNAGKAGCSTVIACGRSPHVLTDILAGKDVGTLVLCAL